MTVVVVGAGGNIGSHLVPHLGRLRGVTRVVLVDPDVYEARNLASQDIGRADVGQPKVLVQARRLRRVAPGLHVTMLAERLEDVPLGRLRGDVLLACLDGRAARRAANLRAFRLGMPLLDAGVRADGLLARLDVFDPRGDGPCWECGREGAEDGDGERVYTCDPPAEAPAPTGAPSALGALAAALQALECGKLLHGPREHLAVGRRVTVSALTHRHFVTRLLPDPACPVDHARWTIATSPTPPEALTVAGALALVPGAARLQVAGQRFVRGLVCPACGERRAFAIRLLGRLEPGLRTCGGCGGGMRPAGSDVVEWVGEAEETASLSGLGVRGGDVLSFLGPDGVAHVQIGGLA